MKDIIQKIYAEKPMLVLSMMLVSVLLLSFQNCAKTEFTQASSKSVDPENNGQSIIDPGDVGEEKDPEEIISQCRDKSVSGHLQEAVQVLKFDDTRVESGNPSIICDYGHNGNHRREDYSSNGNGFMIARYEQVRHLELPENAELCDLELEIVTLSSNGETEAVESMYYDDMFFLSMNGVVLASPCVGPVLVALLAYVAKTQNMLLGFLLLFTFAFGMGQVFLIIGTFSHSLNKLPKAGPWMTGVKALMGLAMLALSVFYVQPILPSGWVGSSEKITNSSKAIDWQSYSEDTFAKAKAEGKPVIIDFYADWCAACIEMEVKTFSSNEVQSIKNQFVWIKYDATNSSSKEFQDLQKKYEIPGLPWFVFYSSQGEHINELTLAGFENPQKFLQRLMRLKEH